MILCAEATYRLTVGPQAAVVFSLVAESVEPNVQLNLTRLAFGPRPIGSTTTQALALYNREDEALEFAFGEMPPYLTVTPASGSIKPRSAASFLVAFKPPAEGPFNASLRCRIPGKVDILTCNAKGEGYPVLCSLSVCGTEPTAVPIGSPTTLDFGKVPIHDRSVRTLALGNAGRHPVDFTWTLPPTLANVVIIAPASGTVAPGADCRIEIALFPTASGMCKNERLECGIMDGPTFRLRLRATAVDPASSSPSSLTMSKTSPVSVLLTAPPST